MLREWARQKLKKLLDVSFVREIRWHDLLQLLLLTLEVDYPLDFLQL
jgi:predicted thioredoxin/glutaredoxin